MAIGAGLTSAITNPMHEEVIKACMAADVMMCHDPDCALDRVSSAGNAAGTGARIALLDVNARGEIEQLVRRIEKIEAAIEPRFQELFIEAMAIPHRSAPFANLRRAVALPEPRFATAESPRRGRRAQPR